MSEFGSQILSEEELYKVRHSLAHLLAQAVLEMFPEAKLGFGPPVENGFYYDFDLPRTLIPEDLPILEKKMKHLAKQNQKFKMYNLNIADAKAMYSQLDQPYKLDQIEELAKQGETEVSFYENILPQNEKGVFVDLCKGPHVDHTGKLGAFKLMRIAGAYFRGDENNKMLQRIYGVAFGDEAELKAYLEALKEAEKRDHRKIGKDLELFTFDEEVGAGLPLWLPKGSIIVEELEELAKKMESLYEYERVRSPHIAKEKLYLRSGHLPYYAESMFPPMELDNEKYYLKAMNCPHHHKIYGAVAKSYRDLPVRYAEYGHCYRYEDSGALFGLMRVRSLCMNDAHIYCTEEQFEAEFSKVIEMYLYYFQLFGIEKYQMRLSKHDKAGLGKKYVDNEALWLKTEDQVRQVLLKLNVPFVEVEGEGAFYGPKIDVQIWSVIGREFTLATNQLDFAVPERFELKYTDKDGSEKTPICIHRAPLSTHERFIGFLIEHFAGAFPVWLAPEQVRIFPVADTHQAYAEQVYEQLKALGVRAKLTEPSESLGKRVRQAELNKVPYMLVIGDQEVQNQSLAVRDYATKAQIDHSLAEFLQLIENQLKPKMPPRN
ncbi:threonine--tRNA ligase [Candidatus Gracilibacteria bacterium]|nr:threonine--tRNA ligase [Candidatus Gracilibacteria bacterium]